MFAFYIVSKNFAKKVCKNIFLNRCYQLYLVIVDNSFYFVYDLLFLVASPVVSLTCTFGTLFIKLQAMSKQLEVRS
jgi:hypothetical protein